MKPVPRSAFTDVSGFEAKKHAIRQTTDGLWQLTLTVSEFGNADWLVFAYRFATYHRPQGYGL